MNETTIAPINEVLFHFTSTTCLSQVGLVFFKHTHTTTKIYINIQTLLYHYVTSIKYFIKDNSLMIAYLLSIGKKVAYSRLRADEDLAINETKRMSF